MNIVCVIGARGGSKGLKNKNIKKLFGKPLIGWSIEQAKKCKKIKRVFVSTDNKDIAKVSEAFGADVPFIRPLYLASDESGKWEVWQHALNAYEEIYQEKVDILVDLDCTSPLRDIEDIEKAIELFQQSKVDAVFSVCEARKNPYFNLVESTDKGLKISKTTDKKIIRRQDAPRVFEHVASIYILSPDYVRKGTGLLSGETIGYDIGQDKSVDIDSEFDFALMEFLFEKKGRNV